MLNKTSVTRRVAMDMARRSWSFTAIWLKRIGRLAVRSVWWTIGWPLPIGRHWSYRVNPKNGRERFVAPWELVALVGLYIAGSMTSNGDFGLVWWLSVGLAFTVSVMVVSRVPSARAYLMSMPGWVGSTLLMFLENVRRRVWCATATYARRARWQGKLFGAYLWHQWPVWLVNSRRCGRAVMVQSWRSGWYVIGFRWQSGAKGWYGYRKRSHEAHPDYFTPLEALVAISSLAWAWRYASDLSFEAWHKPWIHILWIFARGVPMLVFVILLADRHYRRQHRALLATREANDLVAKTILRLKGAPSSAVSDDISNM